MCCCNCFWTANKVSKVGIGADLVIGLLPVLVICCNIDESDFVVLNRSFRVDAVAIEGVVTVLVVALD